MVTGYEGNFLFINGRQIAPPQTKTGVPPSEIHGVGAIGSQVYAVMHISETQGGPVSAPSRTGLLVPVSSDTETLDLFSGTRLDAVPTGMCATDGEAVWFMSGTVLYRTDGKECVRITDIGTCGFNDTSTVRSIRPLPDGGYLLPPPRHMRVVAGQFRRRADEQLSVDPLRGADTRHPRDRRPAAVGDDCYWCRRRGDDSSTKPYNWTIRHNSPYKFARILHKHWRVVRDILRWGWESAVVNRRLRAR